ncbi:hypothetical protein [Collimonas silvisoli]|uniref:hypothetical protein n=1 Tax=Collimonas silvisoli TaxID=2825884 RepID=UPI001B8B279A|nr:hypothetical protein [Collimonas silvisoli]
MKKLLGALTLLLAFTPLVYAQNQPMPRPEPGVGLDGHPDARNDRHPESYYDGTRRIGTHSVIRCKDGAMRKARADACRGHDHEPK